MTPEAPVPTDGDPGRARTATLTLECDARCVRAARAFATRLADLVLPDDRVLHERDVQSLALMVSELVTNAVEHGDGGVVVTIRCPGERLRVEITDAGSAVPERRYAMPGALSGRGLEIVERLAQGWGWEPLASGGKRVWFEY
jgi:anti-sigma regulatory factor (Ser/Thr protein kinase)